MRFGCRAKSDRILDILCERGGSREYVSFFDESGNVQLALGILGVVAVVVVVGVVVVVVITLGILGTPEREMLTTRNASYKQTTIQNKQQFKPTSGSSNNKTLGPTTFTCLASI